MGKIVFASLFVVFAACAALFAQENHAGHGTAQNINIEGAIKATGVIKKINHDHLSPDHLMVNIFHSPIAQLKWPAMNMKFDVADHTIIHVFNNGDKVNFEFIQKDGKNIIVKMSK